MPTTDLITISPADIGLPPKFNSWRPGQYSSIITSAESELPFVAGCQPTGSGKSVWIVATGILMGGRTVILTSTKALQQQYENDFASSGIVQMSGRANYKCGHFTGKTCADGRLKKCPMQRSGNCSYMKARETFLKAPLAVTNYDYYLSSVIHGDGCGQITTLALDEAHTAESQLSDALKVELHHTTNDVIYKLMSRQIPAYKSSLSTWIDWAKSSIPDLKHLIDSIRNDESQHTILVRADRLLQELTRLADASNDWILDENEAKHTIAFSPLWPTKFARQYLYRSAKKVLLSSATIVPKTLHLLDVPDSESLFLESPYTFNPRRAPVYLIGRHRIDFRTTESQWDVTLGLMDSIIQRRQDRKAIIHSVSYDRQRFIKNNSHYWQVMFSPAAHELNEQIEMFRQSEPPHILVSPSVHTGYDFPMHDCEYQIIIKVPFIDARQKIIKARVDSDPEYAHYQTAQTLTQMCGRPMRSAEDQVENFILDQHANWFLRSKEYKGYRHLFPSWFGGLIQYVKYGIPEPPPPLPYL